MEQPDQPSDGQSDRCVEVVHLACFMKLYELAFFPVSLIKPQEAFV
jgi:hypothetical protein